MINNSVQNAYGRIIGFRCHECGGVFEAMWGEVCNGCREKERRHREVLEALRAMQSAQTVEAESK